VFVEQDSRKLGWSTLLIPFTELWLATVTISINGSLGPTRRPFYGSTSQNVCVKQQETSTSSGWKARMDMELANAISLHRFESVVRHRFIFNPSVLPLQVFGIANA
jgi:hypothetical protein